jgi:hypothetical protein
MDGPALLLIALLQATPPQAAAQPAAPNQPSPVPQGGTMYDGNNAQLALPPEATEPRPARRGGPGGTVLQGRESSSNTSTESKTPAGSGGGR